MLGNEKYGVQVYRFGVVVQGDGRKRIKWPGGHQTVERRRCAGSSRRGRIRGWSWRSARRLEFVAANADTTFGTHLTLTYRARKEAWEDDEARNRRVIRHSKADLHRFLSCLRVQMGRYLWVQEFQARGVIHYHLVCENEVPQERASEVWCRATNQLDDADVMRYGVKAESIRHQHAAKTYLGRYVGKARQKCLPNGVDGAGRWWGRSRSLQLILLDEVISHDKSDGIRRLAELRTVRVVRRFLGKVFGGKFRGGMFLDWGGKLTARLETIVARLRAYYGTTPSLEEMLGNSWTPIEEVAHAVTE